MELTSEELQKIEEYAALFMSINEIAILLKKDKNEFKKEINNESSIANYAYMRGKTFSKMELRKNVIKMAKHGSPNAEAMVQKYITKQQIDDSR